MQWLNRLRVFGQGSRSKIVRLLGGKKEISGTLLFKLHRAAMAFAFGQVGYA